MKQRWIALVEITDEREEGEAFLTKEQVTDLILTSDRGFEAGVEVKIHILTKKEPHA